MTVVFGHWIPDDVVNNHCLICNYPAPCGAYIPDGPNEVLHVAICQECADTWGHTAFCQSCGSLLKHHGAISVPPRAVLKVTCSEGAQITVQFAGLRAIPVYSTFCV